MIIVGSLASTPKCLQAAAAEQPQRDQKGKEEPADIGDLQRPPDEPVALDRGRPPDVPTALPVRHLRV